MTRTHHHIRCAFIKLLLWIIALGSSHAGTLILKSSIFGRNFLIIESVRKLKSCLKKLNLLFRLTKSPKNYNQLSPSIIQALELWFFDVVRTSISSSNWRRNSSLFFFLRWYFPPSQPIQDFLWILVWKLEFVFDQGIHHQNAQIWSTVGRKCSFLFLIRKDWRSWQ